MIAAVSPYPWGLRPDGASFHLKQDLGGVFLWERNLGFWGGLVVAALIAIFPRYISRSVVASMGIEFPSINFNDLLGSR